MSIGLQGGMLSESFGGSKVDAGESGDPAFATTNVEGSGMDLPWVSISFIVIGMWGFQGSILLLRRSIWVIQMNLRLMQRII